MHKLITTKLYNKFILHKFCNILHKFCSLQIHFMVFRKSLQQWFTNWEVAAPPPPACVKLQQHDPQDQVT